MCLSIPSKIESINGNKAIASVGGTECEVSLQLIEDMDIKVGDYVLVHTGFAIQKISEEDARETFKILEELEEIEKKIDKEDEEGDKK